MRSRAARPHVILLLALSTTALPSCGRSAANLDPDRAALLHDSVEQWIAGLPLRLAEDGPRAWLRYFEADPRFFMASDGALVFPDRDSATVSVRQLARTVSAVDLEWLDLRVQPLAPGLAVVASAYDETITDTLGTATAFRGYMTAVVRHTPDGWRIRNLHWSSPAPPRH
jgi:hypothetical protein